MVIEDLKDVSTGELICADSAKRLTAFIIDFIIISIINSLYIIFVTFFVNLTLEITDPYAIAYIILILINILYFGYPESTYRQATFGKKIVGIKVVTVNNTRISFKEGIFRSVLKLFSIVSLIGILIIFTNEEKQGLHDIIAKTVVVEN